MIDFKPEYRVIERDGWYCPQMSYLVRDETRWFSLMRNGYWVDPDGWNADVADGEDVLCLMQSRDAAEDAIIKAKAINAEGAQNGK